jgi:RNA polymerase sigma factor (sigma-70 family)
MRDFELDHTRGRFRTYLYRVAVNALEDFVRARHERPAGELEPAPGPADRDDPDELWIKEFQHAVLGAVVERLRPELEQQNPVRWRAFEEHGWKGRPAAEVADQLGITRDLVYQHSHRVMKKIREQCLELYEEQIG